MKKVRYAVVGLGHIAQVAVLPAFKNANENSQLTALISSDPVKLKTLSKKYKVPAVYSESNFEDCLKSGQVDALYVCTPNANHQRYAERAAALGIHVLCEKPMTYTEEGSRLLFETVLKSKIKFMVGYRLHFDPANLRAIEYIQAGKLGEVRIFNSVFTYNVKDQNNIRLKKECGGGPLHDIGIYCVNAARYLFRAEPVEVFAFSATHPLDLRFSEVSEMLSVIMRFPQERLASFTCSFGAADQSSYDVVGTSGRLHLESAYDYAADMEMTVQIGEKKTKKRFAMHDQFAPELIYFSDCILNDRQPEPSAVEGLADVRILDAILESARMRAPVIVRSIEKRVRPSPEQEIRCSPVSMPKLVHVTSPSGSKH